MRKMKNRFLYAFKINKMVIFEVKYGAIKENELWYFSTSVGEFIKNKRDWKRCGQCQKALLPKNSIAFDFWIKWDEFHLKDLTKKQYIELLKDIEILKRNYEFIYKGENYDRHFISFQELKNLSMNKN